MVISGLPCQLVTENFVVEDVIDGLWALEWGEFIVTKLLEDLFV